MLACRVLPFDRKWMTIPVRPRLGGSTSSDGNVELGRPFLQDLCNWWGDAEFRYLGGLSLAAIVAASSIKSGALKH
jgi:hypothetical protein